MGLGDLPLMISGVVGSDALAVAASGRTVLPPPMGPGRVLTFEAVRQISRKLQGRASSVHARIAAAQAVQGEGEEGPGDLHSHNRSHSHGIHR